MSRTTGKRAKNLQIGQLSAFTHNRFVLSSLVSKDFTLKYRRSILGIVWSVLNPLLMMVVLTAVFSYMFKWDIEHYPLYLILGNIIFTLMANSTTTAMTSIIDASALIKKIRIEKMLFPLEKVMFELLNFATSLVAAAAVVIYFQVPLTVNILFLPLLLVYVIIFCVGLSLILSSLAVFFRDVIHLWSVIITAWTYATPLFYPVDLLQDWMQAIMQFNPMYHFVTYFREIMMWNTTPGITENLLCFSMAAITLLFGLFVFRKTEKKFVLFV